MVHPAYLRATTVGPTMTTTEFVDSLLEGRSDFSSVVLEVGANIDSHPKARDVREHLMRRSSEENPLILNGARLRGLVATSLDFSFCEAEGADFSQATLDQSILRHSLLRGAGMQGVNLARADLRFADLHAAFMHGARCVDSRLDGAYLHGAVLTDAMFDRCQMQNVYLDRAYCLRASFQSANLNHALLSYANFRDANLDGANLTYADVKGANFRHSSIRGIEWASVTGGELAHWE